MYMPFEEGLRLCDKYRELAPLKELLQRTKENLEQPKFNKEAERDRAREVEEAYIEEEETLRRGRREPMKRKKTTSHRMGVVQVCML
jgi:hypothetical protein